MYSYGYARNRRPVARGLDGLEGFEERQAIRDEYNALAGHLQEIVSTMPPCIRPAVEMYLGRARAVIGRGAQHGDLMEIRAKVAEWEVIIFQVGAAERAAVARVVAEQQAAALKAEAQMVAASEAADRIVAAKEAAAEAAAQRAAAAATVEQRAAAAASDAQARADVPPGTVPYVQPLKAGLLDNPLLIAVAVGALIFLLKK